MQRIIITGNGTEVGKTVCAAIVATALGADYWKPVQSGCMQESDSETMRTLLDANRHYIHPPAYSLQAALSPHHAARLEEISIEPHSIQAPLAARPLIIETAGGPLAPLTPTSTAFDLFSSWNAGWIVVSRHYLGSINHTLLTLGFLQSRKQPILGIIFNGSPQPDSENAILSISQVPALARLLPEKIINIHTIQRYATQWKPLLQHISS